MTAQEQSDWLRFQIEQANETFRFLVGFSATCFGFLTAVGIALALYGVQAPSRLAMSGATATVVICLFLWVRVAKFLRTLALAAAQAERAARLEQPGVVETVLRSAGKVELFYSSEHTARPIGRKVSVLIAAIATTMAALTIWMPF